MNQIVIGLFVAWNALGFFLFGILYCELLEKHEQSIKKWKLVLLTLPFGLVTTFGVSTIVITIAFHDSLFNKLMSLVNWLER